MMRNNRNKKRVITVFYFLIYILIAIFCLRKFLLLDGVIGYRHDWTINYFDLKNFWQSAISIWQTEALGSLTTYGGPAYLANFSVGLLSFLGLSGAIFSKIFSILLMAGSGISMYHLARELKLKSLVAFLIGMFYLLTPVVFNNLTAGYTWYLLSYALSPLVLLFYFRAVDSGDGKYHWRYSLISALLLSLAVCQIHFAVMLMLMMVVYLPFSAKKILRGVGTIFLIGAITILIHLPWILPTLLTSASSINQSANQASVAAWNKVMSGELTNGFYLTTFYAKRYFLSLVEGSHSWQLASLFVPILAFSAIVLTRRKKVIYFSLLALVGIFLAKGVNPPLENFSNWLYSQPFFGAAFRQSYHWIFLATISFAGLIGFTLNAISDFFAKHKKLTVFNYLLYFGFLILLFFYSRPMFTGDFSSQLQSYKPDIAYSKIYNELKNDPADYRVLWLPAIGPVKQNDLKYSINFDPFIEDVSKGSFSSEGGILFFAGNSTKMRNYILYYLYNNEGLTNLGKILSLANIQKVFLRSDYQSDYPVVSDLNVFPDLKKNWENKDLQPILSENLKLIGNNPPVITYENSENKNHLYATINPIFTTKDLSILMDKKVTNDTFFFASQNSFDNLKNNLNLDSEPDKNEMIINLINQNYVINPADYIRKYFDARDGWIKGNNWFWYNEVFAAQIDDFVFSKKQDSLQIPVNIKAQGKYQIMIKSFGAVNNTEVGIRIGGQNLTLQPSTNSFSWQNLEDVNLVSGKQNIEITSITGEPAISKIVVAPAAELSETTDKASKLISTYTDSKPNYDSTAQVAFEKISLTHYKIKVKNQAPFFLVFSENYNPNWILKAGSYQFDHFLANGYANAFYVDKTGEYAVDLYLNSQKLYNLGLVIALMVILGSTVVIYKSSKIINSNI